MSEGAFHHFEADMPAELERTLEVLSRRPDDQRPCRLTVDYIGARIVRIDMDASGGIGDPAYCDACGGPCRDESEPVEDSDA